MTTNTSLDTLTMQVMFTNENNAEEYPPYIPEDDKGYQSVYDYPG